MKTLYEVFDEFENAKSKKERMQVIGNNLSQTLVDVFKLTYHPDFKWKIKELPVDINVEDEARKIDIEDLEESAKQALMGYAQSIPALAAQGQDVQGPIKALAKVIDDRRKGKSLADSVVEAFTPEPEPEVETPEEPTMSPEEMAMQEMMGGMAPEEQLPEGMTPQGTMQGVAPGQQGMAPGGQPDLMTLLAGLGAGGRPNLGASVQRRTAI